MSSLSRWLLFLDGDKSVLDIAETTDVGIGFVVGYSIIAFAFYVCMVHAIFIITLPPKRREYFGNILFLLPWTSLVLLLESCSLAVEASGVKQGSNLHRLISKGWIKFIYVLHATIAPTILLGTFEITFLVHRKRLLAFCCLERQHPDDNVDNLSSTTTLEDQPDPLQQSQQSQFGWRNGESKFQNGFQKYASLALRSGIWFSASLLMALSLIVYFAPSDWPRFNEDDAENQIGRTGWSTLIVHRYNFRLVLSLLPMAVVSISCLYFAMTLWRYGTTYAMVVHSSWFHPWFLPFYGDLVMIGGQWVGGRTWFALISRVGILCYLECLNWALQEVSLDIEAAKHFQSFLHVIGTTERVMGHHSVSGGQGGISNSSHHRNQIRRANSSNVASRTNTAPTPTSAPELPLQQLQPPLKEQELQELSSTVARGG